MDAIVNAGSALTGGKAAHRRLLAYPPYPEKVRIVVELQKIAAPILKARGVAVSPWRLDEAHKAAGACQTLWQRNGTLNVQVGRTANDCHVPRVYT